MLLPPSSPQADTEFLAEREKLMSDWRAWHESRKAWAEQQRQFFIATMGDRWVPGRETPTVRELVAAATGRGIGGGGWLWGMCTLILMMY